MWVRRAFYWAQFAAIVLLPAWIVVARAIAPAGLGAQDVLIFLAWPALAVAMVVVLGLTHARQAVRTTRTLSWTDVAALASWYTVAVAYGAFIAASSQLGAGLTGGLLVLLSIVVSALAVWQLVIAARTRVQTVLAGLDRSTVPLGDTVRSGEYRARRFTPSDAPVIRIEEPRR